MKNVALTILEQKSKSGDIYSVIGSYRANMYTLPTITIATTP